MNFSIIIPTLNEEKILPTNLQALQPMRKFAQIIVVDGGSSDNTIALATPLADLVLTSAPSRAKQMNQGARHANGEVLIFLHADTRLPGNALNLIDQAITYKGHWGRFDIQLSGSHFMLAIIARMMNWRSQLTGIATGDQVIFTTRRAFALAGGYPDIALMEDITLCRALKKIGTPACLHAKVISSGRRWEQFGVFKTIFLMWSLRLRYFWGENPETLAYLYSRGLFWKP